MESNADSLDTHLIAENDEQHDKQDENRKIRNSRWFVLEPAVMLIFFSWSVSGTVFQNQIIYQTCTVQFGYNETICSLLGTQNATNNTQIIESIVQPYAANIFMAHTIIQSIVPAFVSLFVGPWSDKFGRKPVILAVFIGYLISFIGTAITIYISSILVVSPWFYLLASMPMAVLGGNCVLITGIFCYISDISNKQNRAMRMAYLEAALYLGLVIGSMSTSYILQLTSVIMLFGVSVLASLLAVIYVICFVNESIEYSESQNSLTKFCAIFDVSLVSNMFYTFRRRREHWDRLIIWLIIISLGGSIFVLEGNLTVFYLYIREKFDWTIKQYTFYEAASIIIQIFGNVIGMFFLKKMIGTSETILVFISYISTISNYTIIALAYYSWHLYAATGSSILKGIASPISRTILANTVAPNEIGKIYSLTTSIEALTPLASAPLYSFVYSNTLKVYPGAFNFISVGTYVLCLFLILVVHILQKKSPTVNYGELQR